MRIRLNYSRRGLEVDLPESSQPIVLARKPAKPLADSESTFEQTLDDPIGTDSLAAIAKGKTSACILICDITRPVPNELMLPPILRRLEEAGIERREILILVATGLHRPNEGDELRELVGSFVYENYRIENHFGQAKGAHQFLGTSPNGVPIWIDDRYVTADLKIATGLIEPHFMAGFSGGRKLICPGIASIETIRAWHSPKFLESPSAIAGVLDGNPVHEENSWIAKNVGCDFIANVVIDDDRQPLGYFCGDLEAAFLEGVRFVREIVRDTVVEPVDIVVTTSAGYPLDTTFYQSVKGMVGAANVVKPGGTIVIAAGMEEGIGSSEFQNIFKDFDRLEDFMDAIISGDYFQMDQWQLEELAKVVRKAEVVVVTDGLPKRVVESLFVQHAESVEGALASAMAKHGADASIAVIPEGPYVLAEVEPA